MSANKLYTRYARMSLYFCNYVVQQVISLRIWNLVECMLRMLKEHFIALSYDKFASYVVVKFLK